MRTSGHPRWVRRLEIHVSGGDATGNTVSADIERPPAIETALTAARTATADGAGADAETGSPQALD